MCKKIIDRSGELLRWARANHLTIDILNRKWLTYVQTSALWCSALCRTQASELERAQPKAARLLFGQWRPSPKPNPCIEVGWPLIQTCLQHGRMRLLSRILGTANEIVQAVAEASLLDPCGWVALEAGDARQLAPQCLPSTDVGW